MFQSFVKGHQLHRGPFRNSRVSNNWLLFALLYYSFLRDFYTLSLFDHIAEIFQLRELIMVTLMGFL